MRERVCPPHQNPLETLLGGTMDRVIDLSKYIVLNKVEIYRDSITVVYKVWLKGHHHIPGARWIKGQSGPETEIKYVTSQEG